MADTANYTFFFLTADKVIMAVTALSGVMIDEKPLCLASHSTQNKVSLHLGP